MRITGTAIRKRRLRVLDGVARFVNAIHSEDQSVEIFAAGRLHTLDFVDVIRRVTLMSRAERAGKGRRDGVVFVIL